MIRSTLQRTYSDTSANGLQGAIKQDEDPDIRMCDLSRPHRRFRLRDGSSNQRPRTHGVHKRKRPADDLRRGPCRPERCDRRWSYRCCWSRQRGRCPRRGHGHRRAAAATSCPAWPEMHAHVPPAAEMPQRERLKRSLPLHPPTGITTNPGHAWLRLSDPARRRDRARQPPSGRTSTLGLPSINGNSAPAPDDAERLVRAHKEQATTCKRSIRAFRARTWDRMAAVAQEVGLTFGGHVPADVGIVHAIETGMSTVDHLERVRAGGRARRRTVPSERTGRPAGT